MKLFNVLLIFFMLILLFLFYTRSPNDKLQYLQFTGWLEDENQEIKYYLYFHTKRAIFVILPICDFNMKYLTKEYNLKIKNNNIIDINSKKYKIIFDV